jgi:hypothetical protein
MNERISPLAGQRRDPPDARGERETILPGAPSVPPRAAFSVAACLQEALDRLADARRQLDDLLEVALDAVSERPMFDTTGADERLRARAVELLQQVRQAEHSIEAGLER